MGKKASKKIGKNNNSIINSNKPDLKLDEYKKQKMESKLLELSDDEIEKLFELGKINQSEYEYILGLRKKRKQKEKTQKEKFEERIRCNNTIIDKIIKLGRKFRKQELAIKQEQMELRKMALEDDELEQDIERDERVRDKRTKGRQKQRDRERSERGFGGRGRERDR